MLRYLVPSPAIVRPAVIQRAMYIYIIGDERDDKEFVRRDQRYTFGPEAFIRGYRPLLSVIDRDRVGSNSL